MAFPKLLQKLFQNNGAGDKLNPDIIPEMNYLPTSGGTVNGSITVDGGNYRGLVRGAGVKDFEIVGANNDGSFTFCPGKSPAYAAKKSASLILTSTDYTGITITEKGAFRLSAMDATTGNKTLSGSPNGTLTWCEHNVITVIAESYSANSWYRKYSDGWIEQGGNVNVAYGRTTSVTLNIAMTTTTYTVVLGNNGGVESACRVHVESNTQISITRFYSGENRGGGPCFWYACGK